MENGQLAFAFLYLRSCLFLCISALLDAPTTLIVLDECHSHVPSSVLLRPCHHGRRRWFNLLQHVLRPPGFHVCLPRLRTGLAYARGRADAQPVTMTGQVSPLRPGSTRGLPA